MNAPERLCFLPDIQASADHRQQAIDKVGVKGLRYPLALFDAQGQVQHTVAEVNMAVGLPPEVKGTHMSRFVAWLDGQSQAMDAATLSRELALMHALLAQPGHAVTKERLYELVFPGQLDVQYEAIEVVVYRLRKKLADSGASIRTLRGIGYVLEEQT